MKDNLRIGFDGRILYGHQRGMGRYAYHLIDTLSCIAPENKYYIYTDHPLSVDFSARPNVTTRLLEKKYFWSNTALRSAARADVLDLMHFPSNTCWNIKGCPTVVTLHDVNPLLDTRFGIKNLLLYCYYLISILNAADRVITESNASCREISRIFHPLSNKSKVIYAGIENKFRQPGAETKRTAPYLLFVGGSDPNKNLLTVLNSMKLLQTQDDFEIPLVVVGKKINHKNSTRIVETIRQLNISSLITWPDTITDEALIALYQNATALVFPSFHEGFGFPILEAMACGIPVITSNTSSMAEIAGGAAFLIDPHSPEDIARAIFAVSKDKDIRDRLVNSGLKRCNDFVWERTAHETLELYKSALDLKDQQV